MERWLALLAAGIAGGFTGSVAGLASVVTYPVLLLCGLSPLTANITNTIALVTNGIGSIGGSRVELATERPLIRRLAPVTVVAGLAGSLTLLSTPPGVFDVIVPFLIGGASAAVLVNRRVVPDRPPGRHDLTAVVLMAAVSFYGGYFGAAAGVLALAVLINVTPTSVHNAIAVKNVVMFLANLAAAVTFVVVRHIDWGAVLPLAVGLFIGGALGPSLVRRLPARGLRLGIGALGIALAIGLAVDTFA